MRGKRGREKRERDLRLGEERARRNRMLKKRKREKGKGKCSESTPIASVPTLGVYLGRRRKVLGELSDRENRRKGR